MKKILLLGLLVPCLALGQEAPKFLRFIPLGEFPPHKEKIVDGVRVHAEYPPGSVPPSKVLLEVAKKKGAPLVFRLREFTNLVSVKPEVGALNLVEGEALGPESWLRTPLPAARQSLGILYRDHRKENWFEPAMKLVPDDPGSFPIGSVRFVNVSPLSVLVRLGKKQAQRIKPGGVLVKTLNQGANPMLVGYEPAGGGAVSVFENAMILKPNKRIQAFLYKAQGKSPRKAVKLFHASESYSPPPKAKKSGSVAGTQGS